MKEKFKGLLACFFIACFFAYELMQLHMLNALGPTLIKDLSLSATDFSLLCSSYLLADVLFLIPAGMILDRVSVRKISLISLGLCVVGTFGFAASTTLYQAAVFHFFSGIGNAFCFLSCMILASSWFGKKSSLVMSTMVTIGLLGGVVGHAPVAFLTALFGWRMTLFWAGTLGCLIWVLNYLFVKESGDRALDKRPFSMGDVLVNCKEAIRNGVVWKCGIYTGFLNLPLMLISAMMGSLYLTEVLHFDPVDASCITSMILWGTIIGSPFYGFLADISRRKKIWMVSGALLSFLSFLVLLWIEQPTLGQMVLVFFALGFFSASQVLGYPMIAESSSEQSKGLSMGVAAVLIMGLAGLAQPLAGWLIDLASTQNGYNFTYAFLIFPIGFLISLAITSMIRESRREPVQLEI